MRHLQAGLPQGRHPDGPGAIAASRNPLPAPAPFATHSSEASKVDPSPFSNPIQMHVYKPDPTPCQITHSYCTKINNFVQYARKKLYASRRRSLPSPLLPDDLTKKIIFQTVVSVGACTLRGGFGEGRKGHGKESSPGGEEMIYCVERELSLKFLRF